MCGIWGIFDKTGKGFFPSDVAKMKAMAIITSLRGDDSTGLFSVGEPDKPPKIFKQLGGAAFLWNIEETEKMQDYIVKNAKAVVGHGRLATKGKVIVKNAHPFKEGSVTMVHNGTIEELSGEVKEEEVRPDSFFLCKKMAKEGVAEAIKSLKGTQVSYAIIAHDTNSKQIHLARNLQRPLHYVETFDRVYVMSDYQHLNMFISKYISEINKYPIALETEKLYTFDLEKGIFLDGKEDLYVKKFYPVVGYGESSNYKYKSHKKIFDYSKVKYKQGDTIQFYINDIYKSSAKADQWRHECLSILDEGDVEVVFFTNVPRTDLKDDFVGQAKIATVMWDDLTDMPYYLVRNKEIEWTAVEPEPLPKKVELATGEITEAEWKDICDNKECEGCKSKIDDEEAEDTAFSERSGKVWCKDCVSDMKEAYQINDDAALKGYISQ